MTRRNPVLFFVVVALTLASACSEPLTAATPPPPPRDPLPSWNDGPIKRRIIDYVVRTTTAGGADFIPPDERLATFDNDGTLWPEKPSFVQVAFILARVQRLAAVNPALKKKQPYKAALAGDIASLDQTGQKELMELFAATSTGMTQEEFARDVAEFFATAQHPTLHLPYTALAYRPMVELLALLRDRGFETWICTGGGTDFVRVISQPLYGIPPEQVIGTSIATELLSRDKRLSLVRKPELSGVVNDKAGKPVGIGLHVGRRPVFAAGNVRSGGDIEMLAYAQANRRPSFEIVIDHDDAEREFAYQEKNGETIAAARAHGWPVVSMKRDWKTIFGSRVETFGSSTAPPSTAAASSAAAPTAAASTAGSSTAPSSTPPSSTVPSSTVPSSPAP
jgi:phosphoglycolate phosphatase-like HAD superfamily hydrolase